MTEDEARQCSAIYERNSLELFAMMNGFSRVAENKTGQELLDHKRQECEWLINLLQRHRRDLGWRAGEKIEPMVHFAEASLAGKAGIDA